jgi:hypothetical protein
MQIIVSVVFIADLWSGRLTVGLRSDRLSGGWPGDFGSFSRGTRTIPRGFFATSVTGRFIFKASDDGCAVRGIANAPSSCCKHAFGATGGVSGAPEKVQFTFSAANVRSAGRARPGLVARATV